jgi:hypothetical protein
MPQPELSIDAAAAAQGVESTMGVEYIRHDLTRIKQSPMPHGFHSAIPHVTSCNLFNKK